MPRVLIVDDDSSVRRVLSQMLEAVGYSVVTARNGLDAVNLFYFEGDQIDLVLTDLRMPVMDGYETVDRIRRSKPALPIICMSGYSPEGSPAGTVFLAKPFNMASVQHCIEKAFSSAAVR
jgi:two-component system, cell cycle sensor histidine kinase and response regulator CckA